MRDVVAVISMLVFFIGCANDAAESWPLSKLSAAQRNGSAGVPFEPYATSYCGDPGRESEEDLVCQTNEAITYLHYAINDPQAASRARSAIRSGATWYFYVALQKGSAYENLSNPYPDDANDVTYMSVRHSERTYEVLTEGDVVYGYLPAWWFCGINDSDTISPRALNIAYHLGTTQGEFITRNIRVTDFRVEQQDDGSAQFVRQTGTPGWVTWRGTKVLCDNSIVVGPPSQSQPSTFDAGDVFAMCGSPDDPTTLSWCEQVGQQVTYAYIESVDSAWRDFVHNAQYNAQVRGRTGSTSSTATFGKVTLLFCSESRCGYVARGKFDPADMRIEEQDPFRVYRYFRLSDLDWDGPAPGGLVYIQGAVVIVDDGSTALDMNFQGYVQWVSLSRR